MTGTEGFRTLKERLKHAGLPSVLMLAIIAGMLLVGSAYAASSPTSVSLTSKLNPSTYGVPVTLTATLKGNVPNGEVVSFYDNGTVIGSNAITSNTASLTISSLSVGTHPIIAAYVGDSKLAPSNSPVLNQIVNRELVSLSLTSSQQVTAYGVPITLTATISGNVPNGENITFYDGFKVIGKTRLSSGIASISVQSLSIGAHSFTAFYNGDAIFASSTSVPITQTVSQFLTTVSVSSALSGGSVTLTAKVTSSGGVVPNGEAISFKDGSKLLGSAQITSGAATISSASLASGTHFITATYAGDANYSTSTSPALELIGGNPVSTTSTSTTSVTSTTTIVQQRCMLGVNLTSSAPYYVAPQKILLSYAVKTFGTSCRLPAATGELTVSGEGTGDIFYSAPVNLTNIQSLPVVYQTYVNSTQAQDGSNLAVLVLNSGLLQNLSSTSFYVLQPANISVSNAIVIGGSSVRANSTIRTLSTILNSGAYGASNATLNARVIAPNLSVYALHIKLGSIPSFRNFTVVSSGALGPAQRHPGTYLVVENVSYYSSYPGLTTTYTSNVLYSNSTNFNYTVYPNSYFSYNTLQGPPIAPAWLGQVKVVSSPLYTDILNNASYNNLDSLKLYNTGNAPVTLNITLPKIDFGTIISSANSVTVLPNQTDSVQFQFLPNANALGTYLIPLSIFANATRTQLPMILSISGRASAPQFLNRVDLTNGNRNASVTVSALNPVNTTSYSLQLSINLNSSVTKTSNNIAVSGGIGNFSLDNGTYELTWPIDHLAGNSRVQLQYNITNVTQLTALLFPQMSLSSTRQSSHVQLSIFNVGKPQVVYTNSTANITISAVYTGQNSSLVRFTLTPPLGASVVNPAQIFRVVPNSAITVKFTVKTGQYPGAETFLLSVPGIYTTQTTSIQLNVQSPPTFTVSQYLSDPRTIFGLLTLALYISSLAYTRLSRLYKEKKLRRRSTVGSFDGMRKLARNINVALLSDDGKTKRTFIRHINKDASLGGFVEDSATIGRGVIVTSNAIVQGEALLSGNAKITDNGIVSGHAVVRGDAIVAGNGKVEGDAEVYGRAQVYGNAKVFGQAAVYDDATVTDNAEAFGNAKIYGEARVSGDAKVYGTAEISGDAKISRGKVNKGVIV